MSDETPESDGASIDDEVASLIAEGASRLGALFTIYVASVQARAIADTEVAMRELPVEDWRGHDADSLAFWKGRNEAAFVALIAELAEAGISL